MRISTFLLSQDCGFLVVAYTNGLLRNYRLPSSQIGSDTSPVIVRQWKSTHTAPVLIMKFSESGALLGTGSADFTVKVFRFIFLKLQVILNFELLLTLHYPSTFKVALKTMLLIMTYRTVMLGSSSSRNYSSKFMLANVCGEDGRSRLETKMSQNRNIMSSCTQHIASPQLHRGSHAESLSDFIEC